MIIQEWNIKKPYSKINNNYILRGYKTLGQMIGLTKFYVHKNKGVSCTAQRGLPSTHVTY